MEDPQITGGSSPLRRLKNLVVIRLDGIGDSLLCLPVLRFIKDACPGLKITVAASPAAAEVFRDDAEVIVFNAKEPGPAARLASQLKAGNFDGAVSFTEKGYALEGLRRSGIPLRAGFFPGLSQPFKAAACLLQLTDRVSWSNSPKAGHRLHEVQRFFLLTEKLGLATPERLPSSRLHLTEEEQQRGNANVFRMLETACAEPSLADGRVCAIQLMPRWNSIISQMSFSDPDSLSENAAALSGLLAPVASAYRTLLAQNCFPIFSCAPSDQIWAEIFLNNLRRSLPEAGLQLKSDTEIPLFCSTSLHDFAAFLRSCAFLLSPDGGAVHVAAAVNTPVLAVFPDTNLEACLARWKPWQTECKVIVRETAGTPAENEEKLKNALVRACTDYAARLSAGAE